MADQDEPGACRPRGDRRRGRLAGHRARDEAAARDHRARSDDAGDGWLRRARGARQGPTDRERSRRRPLSARDPRRSRTRGWSGCAAVPREAVRSGSAGERAQRAARRELTVQLVILVAQPAPTTTTIAALSGTLALWI